MDTGSLLYYGGLALWSALVAYAFLKVSTKKEMASETVAPSAVSPVQQVPAAPPAPAPILGKPDPATLNKEGFKAFQRGEELAVEDIVKGLSRE